MKIPVLALVAATALSAGPSWAADPARGQKVFQSWCASCHSPDRREDGNYLPGTETLENKYKGSKPAVLEQRDDLTIDYVEFVIRHGTRAMPMFRKTEISDQDMHDLAVYLAKGKTAPHAAAHSFLEPYFGNTFISRHSDGVEYRVLYSADGRYVLARSGGPDRSADYEVSGTYSVDGNQVCFHAENPPPHALTCVPQDQGRKAGETWEVPTADGGHATHMIVPGLVLHGPAVN
jgi:mono/diheme cytochrome c family protein